MSKTSGAWAPTECSPRTSTCSTTLLFPPSWAYDRGIQLDFIRPGKPIENCFVESFNGKFRDECLNQHWFTSLMDARREIETWRRDYNRVRPHSSLGQLPPAVFAQGAGLRSLEATSSPRPVRLFLSTRFFSVIGEYRLRGAVPSWSVARRPDR